MPSTDLTSIKTDLPDFVYSQNLKDVRQDLAWGDYLQNLGWKKIVTSFGALIMCRKFPLIGSAIKIQHPIPFNSEQLSEMDELCNKEKPFFIKLEPFVGQDISILTQAGYVPSVYPQCVPSTMYVDLTLSNQLLWKNLSTSGKYGVTRAKREGNYVKFFKKPSNEIVEVFYKVCQETALLKKFYLQPITEIKSRVALFGDDSHIAMVYDKNGNVLGGKFYLGNTLGMALYVTGGTTALGRKDHSGFLLMWESFEYLKACGYKIFDLEGVYDPRFPVFTKRWFGFTHFKEKFGGITVRFPFPYVRYANPLLKMLSKVNRLFEF